MTYQVLDSYGVVLFTGSLTACGVWIDPLLGIDIDGSMWGFRNGESVDADRIITNNDGSYTIKMYEAAGGIGGELTIKPVGAP